MSCLGGQTDLTQHGYSMSGQWPQWDGGAYASAGWQCSVCKYQNHCKAKVCRQCNVRRQFADGHGAAPPAAPAATAQQHPINAAASAVQASLLAAAGGAVDMPYPPHSADDAASPHAAERKELEDKIRALENAKASLPAGSLYTSIKSNMDTEIASAKREIINLKPLGMRLKACRGALTRAQQRAERLANIVAEAVHAKEMADKEVADLGQQVAAMELQMGARGNADADCLGVLKSGMIRVLEDMATGGMVQVETVGAARTQMEGLFNQLTTLSAQCRAAPPLRNGAAAGQPVPQPAAQPVPQPLPGTATPPPAAMSLSPVGAATAPVTLQLQHGVQGAQDIMLQNAFQQAAQGGALGGA